MNVEFNETEAYNKPDSEEVAYYKNAVDKERKELISFREKLKEAREKADKLEEVIRELTSSLTYIVETLGTLSTQQDELEALAYYEALRAIQKAKSLTTKDK